MKDSGVEWIGVVPKEWEINKVKHRFIRKKNIPDNNNFEILKLARKGVRVRDISTGEGQIASDYSKYNPVSPLDILINPMDLISGDNCNISELEGVISPAYVNLRFKDGVNPYFFNYYFKLQYWLGSFFTHGKGVSFDNRWTLNDETLRNFYIVYPTLEEQNKITFFLDDKLNRIEQIMFETQQSIIELKKYKQSLITEAVTKGLDKNAEIQYIRSDYTNVKPSNWLSAKLKNLCVMKSGNSIGSEEILDSGKYEVYGANGSRGMHNNYNISGEVLLVGRQGALSGNVHYVKGSIWATEHALITINKGNIIIKYLYYLIKSMNLNQYAHNAAQPGISASFILNRPCFISRDKSEQQQIVDYLDDKTSKIDSLIKDKEQIIKEYEEYKKSLIYEYVTGKKQV